jgi:hypothetical protein
MYIVLKINIKGDCREKQKIFELVESSSRKNFFCVVSAAVCRHVCGTFRGIRNPGTNTIAVYWCRRIVDESYVYFSITAFDTNVFK